jgi:hypothetical protein
MAETGSILSGVWQEEHIRTNATDYTWVELTTLQMPVRVAVCTTTSTIRMCDWCLH